jgi:hypothetical protein
MFNKLARSSDEVLKAFASMALDPKVVGYVIKLPHKDRNGNRYQIKMAADRDRITPKVKSSVLRSPAPQPFNSPAIVNKAIQKEQSKPVTDVKDVAVPKPTYDGKSANMTALSNR